MDDLDGDDWGWNGQASCQLSGAAGSPVQTTPVNTEVASVLYSGVSTSMWAEIESIGAIYGDYNNCAYAVSQIPADGVEIAPCDGNCINQALSQYNVVELLPGTYRISETISIRGKTLIAASPTSVIIDATDVQE